MSSLNLNMDIYNWKYNSYWNTDAAAVLQNLIINITASKKCFYILLPPSLVMTSTLVGLEAVSVTLEYPQYGG